MKPARRMRFRFFRIKEFKNGKRKVYGLWFFGKTNRAYTFCRIGNFVSIRQKCSARMRTRRRGRWLLKQPRLGARMCQGTFFFDGKVNLRFRKATERDFIYASNEPKSVLARDLGDCRDNLRNSRSVFLIVHDNRMLAERAFYCFTDFSGTITKAAGSGQRQRPDE